MKLIEHVCVWLCDKPVLKQVSCVIKLRLTLFTMAFSLNKFKNILNINKDNQLAGSGSLEPEIGFKLALHPVNKNLYVTVIGARHLPSLFGLSRAHGYLVKVWNFLFPYYFFKILIWMLIHYIYKYMDASQNVLI